jgi:hypothetical protein
MSLYFGRTKSQFRARDNWSEGSIIVQEKNEIPGLLNPGLNGFPIFEKMFHGFLGLATSNLQQVAEKRSSASFPLPGGRSFVVGAYLQVRLTPQGFGGLAYAHF